jgi:hypothetical protein
MLNRIKQKVLNVIKPNNVNDVNPFDENLTQSFLNNQNPIQYEVNNTKNSAVNKLEDPNKLIAVNTKVPYVVIDLGDECVPKKQSLASMLSFKK